MKSFILLSFLLLIPLSYSFEIRQMNVEKEDVFVMLVKDASSIVRVANETDGLYVRVSTDPSKGYPDVTYSVTEDGVKLIVVLETEEKSVFLTDSNGDGLPDERLTVFREKGKAVRIVRDSVKYVFEEIREPVEAKNETTETVPSAVSE